MKEMYKRRLRNFLLCTLIVALAFGVFLVDAQNAQAVPELGDNCADCHQDGVPGGGGGGTAKPEAPADKETPASQAPPATQETPAASDAGEEAAEEGGIAGLPLVIGGIVFIVLVVALAMYRNRR